MPRRNSRGNRSGRGRRQNSVPRMLSDGMDRTTTVEGKNLWVLSVVASGTGVQTLTPDNTIIFDNRLFSLSECFQEFRFVDLFIRVTFVQVDTVGLLTFGYSKQFNGTSGISAENVYTNSSSRVFNNQLTVPQILRIPPSILLNQPVKWFATQANVNAGPSNQGYFLYVRDASAGTETLYIEIGYKIQFRGALNPDLAG